mgnify:CR=1 FL=1
MRAYAHLRTYNPKLAKFSTWLYQIARNVARTHLGKQRRRPQTQDLFEDETLEQRIADPSRDALPDQSVIARDEDAGVRAALASIPEKMRTALVLRYFRHLEYQEIAGTMRESLGNVKTLLHRGKSQLAQALSTRDLNLGKTGAAGLGTGSTSPAAALDRERRHEVLCL